MIAIWLSRELEEAEKSWISQAASFPSHVQVVRAADASESNLGVAGGGGGEEVLVFPSRMISKSREGEEAEVFSREVRSALGGCK